jgi:hypothetical protein
MNTQLLATLFGGYAICGAVLWTQRSRVVTGCKILGCQAVILKCNIKIAINTARIHIRLWASKAILAGLISNVWVRSLLKGEPRPDVVFWYRLALDPTYNPDGLELGANAQAEFDRKNPEMYLTPEQERRIEEFDKNPDVSTSRR